MKLTQHIASIGVLAPEVQRVDVSFSTPYGTTYNAYLVRGEKTALIETVPAAFGAEYISNIEKIMAIEQIDYVIFNHTAPEHGGMLGALLEKNPEIGVVATIAGLKNLQGIVNQPFQEILAKDGMQLDLGDDVLLEFLIVPNLPWPDTMFTYFAKEKTLFSGDAMSAHTCDDARYGECFSKFFRHVIAPQKIFLKKAMERISILEIQRICPSHGPILCEKAKEAIEKYTAWSARQENHPKRIAVFYTSATGFTKQLAEACRSALLDTDADVQMYDVAECREETIRQALEGADGILIGTPTINRNAPKPIWDVFSCIDAVAMQQIPVGIFGVCGWSGEACTLLAQHAKALRLNVFETPQKVIFCPAKEDLDRIKAYAMRFYEAVCEI